MRRMIAVWMFAALLIVVVGGCNLFSFTAPDDATVGLVTEGDDALRDGDYEKAIEKYTAALEENPNNADAHWGIAKAYFRQSGFTSITVMSQISTFGSGELPFVGLSMDSANALYHGSIYANRHLSEIFFGNATTSELYDTTIALDFTGILAIQTMLMFRDTDVNDTIDSRDVDMNAFLYGSNLDLTAWDELTPDQQAAMAATLNSLLNDSTGALAALNVFIEALDSNATAGFDTENIEAVLSDLLDGFNNEYGDGGGGIASFSGAHNLRTFTQGGNQ